MLKPEQVLKVSRCCYILSESRPGFRFLSLNNNNQLPEGEAAAIEGEAAAVEHTSIPTCLDLVMLGAHRGHGGNHRIQAEGQLGGTVVEHLFCMHLHCIKIPARFDNWHYQFKGSGSTCCETPLTKTSKLLPEQTIFTSID